MTAVAPSPRASSWPGLLLFLAGLTAINLSDLSRELTGFTVFSAPPLFFLGLFLLVRNGFYRFSVPRKFFLYAALFAISGLLGCIANGFNIFVLRQVIAYLVNVFVCFIVYAEAKKNGFGSVRSAVWILTIYAALYGVFMIERVFGKGIYYLIINAITANPADAWENYLIRSQIPRFFYLQPEPRVAAMAIFSVIVPFILANRRLYRGKGSLILVAVSFLVAALTNSFTATGYILLGMLFLFSEKAAFTASSIFTGIITIGVPIFIGGLVYTGNLEGFFNDILGPKSFGLANAGTLTTTALTLYIAVSAFSQNLLFGLGMGNYAPYFFRVAPTLGGAMSGEIVEKITGQGLSSDYVPTAQSFVMKIMAEQGIVGTVLLLAMTFELYRFSFRSEDRSLDRVALRFVLAAIILSWQAYTSFLNPLYWVAAGLIGNIQRRQAIMRDTKPASLS